MLLPATTSERAWRWRVVMRRLPQVRQTLRQQNSALCSAFPRLDDTIGGDGESPATSRDAQEERDPYWIAH